MEAFVTRVVCLSKMPSDVSDEEIRKAAEEWGDIKNFINISTKGMAFIEYFDLRAAEEARKGLKAKEFGGKSVCANLPGGEGACVWLWVAS